MIALNKKNQNILYNKQLHFLLVMMMLCCINLSYVYSDY